MGTGSGSYQGIASRAAEKLAAKQFAKKVALLSEEKPQRLKAEIDFVALTARLEAAPFQSKVKREAFQQTA